MHLCLGLACVVRLAIGCGCDRLAEEKWQRVSDVVELSIAGENADEIKGYEEWCIRSLGMSSDQCS